MKRTVATVLWVIFVLTAPSYAYKDGDFQVWDTLVEEVKLGPKVKLALEQELRWGESAHDFYYQHYDLGINYKAGKSWTLGTGYRHILSKSQNIYRVENAPYLTAAYANEWAGFKFEDRSRFEYQHFDHQSDNGRYRNKLTVRFPWQFSRWKIQPFISEEIFIRFLPKNQFNQNRVSSGLAVTFSPSVKAEIYYLLHSQKNTGRWSDTNVLGTKVKIAF